MELNRDLLKTHFELTYPDATKSIDWRNIEIVGEYYINTPTFYMYCSDYLLIAAGDLDRHLDGEIIYPDLAIIGEKNGFDTFAMVKHPYFNPPEIIRILDEEE